MTRHQLHTHRARVRLLRFAADVLHQWQPDDVRHKLPTGALGIARRLQAAGVPVSGADLVDYYDARQVIADVDDHVYPGTSREAAIARLDAEEQVVWHEDNVGGIR